MTLERAHALGLGCSLSLAVASVLLGGLLPLWCWLFLLLPWLWPLWHRALGAVPTALGTALAVAAVLAPLAWWQATGRSQGTVLAAVALMAILSVRQATRTLPSHDLQALVLGLLLVCVGALLNPNPSYALVLPPFALCTVAALVTRQLCFDVAQAAFRDGDEALAAAQLQRTDVVTPRFVGVIVGLSVFILLTAGVVFAAFPRVGLPAWGGGGARALPQAVTLGETPWSFGDAQVAARVFGLGLNTFNHGLYLRGRSYDRVGVEGFGESHEPVGLRDLAGQGPALSYEVVQDAAEGDPLLTLGPVQRGVVTTSDNNEVKILHTRGGERPAFVTTVAGSHRGRLTGQVMATRPASAMATAAATAAAAAVQVPVATDTAFFRHYLALPEQLQQPLGPLVAQILAKEVGAGAITGGVKATNEHGQTSPQPLPFAERAARLRAHLTEHFDYDVREPRRAASVDGPLLAFVFEHHRGNCTYFASAYAAMLRVAGVPSRVVGGFEGGRWDGDQAVAVFTGSHAHAWVEWYQPGMGWVLDDATPARAREVLSGYAAWRERLGRFWQMDVLQFNLANQLGFVHGLQSGLVSLRQLAWPSDEATQKAGPALPRSLMASVVGATLVLVVALLWRLRKRQTRRRQRFARVLEAALVRLLQRELLPSQTYRAAAQQLHVAAPTFVLRAIEVHEAMQYGAVPPPTDIASLERSLSTWSA